MKAVILTSLLFFFYSLAYGLSSSTATTAFTLDTVEPTLDLVSPNGGEEWYIGDNNDIVWTASDTNLAPNSVYLWYSLNGGTDYLSIAEGAANTLTFPWQMPDTQSYNARVRIKISDAYGNYAQDTSAAPFSITYVPPASPEGVNVDISNGIDAVITWQPVTHTILPYNTPIIPDGYIVLYNETPYASDQYYYYLCDVISGTSYTHIRVALRRQQMYYRVVAYKDYQSRMANLLETLSQPGAVNLNWADMKRIINGNAGSCNTDLQSVGWGDLQSPPQNPAYMVNPATYPAKPQSPIKQIINGDEGDKRDKGDELLLVEPSGSSAPVDNGISFKPNRINASLQTVKELDSRLRGNDVTGGVK